MYMYMHSTCRQVLGKLIMEECIHIFLLDITYMYIATKVFIGELQATRGVWVIIVMVGPMVMGQQASCKTLIGVHLTMYLMLPN